MSSDKIVRISREIFENIGGQENALKILNCMTRVRIDINDYDKVNIEGLKAINGVMGVVEDDNLQIIVGPGVSTKVATEMNNIKGTSSEKVDRRKLAEDKAAQVKAEHKAKVNNNTPFKRALKSIANIFVPLIPAFVGAGIIGGIASVLSNLIVAGDLSTSWEQYVTVMNIIKNGIFSYLVIYVGINSANEFGASPALGGVVGGITMLTGINAENPLKNIFTGDALSGGQGGIIGVIIAVWLLSLLEKQLRRIIPDSLDIIVTPTIALIIIGLLTIFIIMPIAGAISSGLVGTINAILSIGGAFAGFMLSALFLPMVMFGLHQILTPIHIEMIEQTGCTLLLPILAMAGAGQVGAAIAIWLRCRKNKQLTEIVKGALPVGILGIGEPLIYGVTLPLGRPFITACLGGGIGGAVVGAIGSIGATAIGPSGVALIPLIANGKWLGYVFGLLAAYAGGFVLTYFFGVPKDATKETEI